MNTLSLRWDALPPQVQIAVSSHSAHSGDISSSGSPKWTGQSGSAPSPQASSAPKQPHPARYPRPARSARMVPKVRPSSMLRSPLTFSPRNHRGRDSRRTRTTSGQRKRSSPVPLRRPALEKGWHGKPALTSVGCPPQADRTSSPVTDRMSWVMGTPGKFLASTRRHGSSISQNIVVRKPAASAAIETPPMPEHRSTWVTARTPPCRRRRRRSLSAAPRPSPAGTPPATRRGPSGACRAGRRTSRKRTALATRGTP